MKDRFVFVLVASVLLLNACVLASTSKPHYVPADKQLSPEWMAALTARGERKVYRGEELFTIGMPVSGIASGMLYVRGDGTLARWWMFNEDNCTDFRMKDPETGYRTYRPPSRFQQGMAISVKETGGGGCYNVGVERSRI